MDSYSKAAMERMMKIQEVLLRAMARKITWFQAAEILGFTDRHVLRVRATSREVLQSECSPCSREAEGGTPNRFELQLGEGSAAGSGVGGAGQATRSARQAVTTTALAGACCWTLMAADIGGFKMSTGRPDRDPGRCQQPDLLRAVGGRGIKPRARVGRVDLPGAFAADPTCNSEFA